MIAHVPSRSGTVAYTFPSPLGTKCFARFKVAHP